MELSTLDIILVAAAAAMAAAVAVVLLRRKRFAIKTARRLDEKYSDLLRESESEIRRLNIIVGELKNLSAVKPSAAGNQSSSMEIEKFAAEHKKIETKEQELYDRNKQLWDMSVAIEKERQRIETAKNEIEKKSQYLEKALQDLRAAQDELIRQNKMVTVGKLTQGLVDRILNPLNYINNFTKLSEGLVRDIAANIEDDKDKMDEENYEDTVDVLQMLQGNLRKVAEHGLCTTRTLKAMEEVIKDRTGGMTPTDLKSILAKNKEMTTAYHEDCIKKYGIQVTFDLPDSPMPIEGNPELLSKTFMSVVNNSFYAVAKKAERVKYDPEIRITAEIGDGAYTIRCYDNGIGIEEKILDKVFDPFFTTKPTGEASGVGLYLSREIVQNHHGDITAKSEKDKFTEFTVKFDTTKTTN